MEGPHQDDSGWERWTIGPGGKDAHNWERLFEVHGVWPKDFQGYLSDLSEVKKPRQVIVVPQEGYSGEEWWPFAIDRWKKTHQLGDDTLKGSFEAVIPYPRNKIIERFGRRMWFSSSISWCIALAIEEGATDIGLWGIDLESGEEYVSQFVGCAHFLDLARIVGINIHLPRDCGLLRDLNPYPDRYETHLALTFEKKVKWIQSHAGNLEQQVMNLQAEVHRQEGRLFTMRSLPPEAGIKPEDIKEAERVLIANNTHLGQMVANLNQLKGELGATQFYQRMYVWGQIDPQETRI